MLPHTIYLTEAFIPCDLHVTEVQSNVVTLPVNSKVAQVKSSPYGTI